MPLLRRPLMVIGIKIGSLVVAARWPISRRAVSVRLSVTFVYCDVTSKYIIKLFYRPVATPF